MKRRLLLSVLVLTGAIGVWVAASFLIPSTLSAQIRPTNPRPAAQPLQQVDSTTIFTATTGMQRGQINLNWRYSGKAFRGAFLVERSNNGTTWAPVTTCSLAYSSRSTAYRCTDSKLTSGRSYYYRICIPATGSKTCTISNATVPAKTPTKAP
jgi:hypothetical protein